MHLTCGLLIIAHNFHENWLVLIDQHVIGDYWLGTSPGIHHTWRRVHSIGPSELLPSEGVHQLRCILCRYRGSWWKRIYYWSGSLQLCLNWRNMCSGRNNWLMLLTTYKSLLIDILSTNHVSLWVWDDFLKSRGWQSCRNLLLSDYLVLGCLSLID